MKKRQTQLILLLVLIALICLYTCNQCAGKRNGQSTPSNTSLPFVRPPLAEADVPFTRYQFEAVSGDTLLHASGSLLVFPPESFVDAKGNPVKGEVEVAYREFPDPVDMYRAGIPMGYDTLGQQHYFESSGMCEIRASQKGVPVFVNPANHPTLHLVSKNPDPHTLYYLDTVSRKWVPRGSTEALDLHASPQKSTANNLLTAEVPPPPVKPEKADERQPVLHVYIDPASFEELLCYDNQLFQVDITRSPFNPKDTAEEWNDLKLQKARQKGLYMVDFSNARKKVSYFVKPVLKGASFDKALAKYKELEKAYQKTKAEAVARLKKDKEAALKDSLETVALLERNRKVEAINRMIDLENKRIEKENVKIVRENKRITDKREAIKREEMMLQQMENERKSLLQNDYLVRTFDLTEMGTWNCDRPLDLKLNQAKWTYEDENGQPIQPEMLSVAYKGVNGIVSAKDTGVVFISETRLNVIIGFFQNQMVYAEVPPTPANTEGHLAEKSIRMIAPKNDELARATIKGILKNQ